MLRFADLEGEVEQPRRKPLEEAPAQDARPSLLALQRAAGNQAVTRMLQRSVKIGARLGNGAVEHTDAGGVAALVVQLGGRLVAPAWLSAWVQGELNTLVTGGAPYDFDTADQVLDWLLLREVTTRLHNYVARNNPNHAGDRGTAMMATYQKVEALRTRYAQTGEASGNFTVFGLTYTLRKEGAGHYYAARGGHEVLYSNLSRETAAGILAHLEYNGEAEQYGNDVAVDNWVCSFLAEPSRWPQDQFFNLLATTKTGAPQTNMVGQQGILPMAGGTTWNKDLGVIARGLPLRALEYGENEGLKALIDVALPASTGVGPLAQAVGQSLDVLA
jgi:hypothetical protein